MDQACEDWIAHIAEAMCVASRWLAGTAVAMVIIAAMGLVLLPPVPTLAKLGLGLVLALGAIQVYVTVRIELDRRLFEFMVEHSGRGAQRLADLDSAMYTLRLRRQAAPTRDLTERVQGLISLIRRLGWVVVGQLVLLAMLPWFY